MGQFPETSHVSIRECAVCLPFNPEDSPLPLLLDFHLGKVHNIGKELSFIGFAFFFPMGNTSREPEGRGYLWPG